MAHTSGVCLCGMSSTLKDSDVPPAAPLPRVAGTGTRDDAGEVAANEVMSNQCAEPRMLIVGASFWRGCLDCMGCYMNAGWDCRASMRQVN